MKKLIFLLIVLAISAACKKKLFDRKLATTERKANFDYLWTQIDKKFSYFDVKNLNWDSIHEVYNAQIHEDLTDTEFFTIMGNMVKELKDDYSNLSSPFDVSVYNYASQFSPQYHAPLLPHLFPDLHYTGPFAHTMIPNETIAYVRFSSFGNMIDGDVLDWLMNQYKGNTTGMIIDVRNNGGGYAANVGILLGRFVNQRTLVAYEQMRNGENHGDFSNPIPIYIDPKGTFYDKPVVVLTDRGSYSATTFFALSTKALPNMTLIGDATGGGGGLPNGGQLPNGWTYRFSISRLLDVNQQNYAEQGVPADIPVNFDWTDLTRDEIIEAAISHLN